MSRERVDAITGDCRDREYLDTWRGDRHFGNGRRDIANEIALREHDNRQRAALPRQREIALEATGVHIASESRRDECDVDVRRDDLRRRRVAGRFSNEGTSARDDEPHDTGAVAGTRPRAYPVANRDRRERVTPFPRLGGC